MKVSLRPYEILVRFHPDNSVHFAVTRMLCEDTPDGLKDIAERQIEAASAEEVEAALGEKGALVARVSELEARNAQLARELEDALSRLKESVE